MSPDLVVPAAGVMETVGPPTPASTVVVMTMFEAGHYEIGAMSLCNSLVRNGYRGTVWCGVKGVAPSWAGTVPDQEGSVEVRVVPLDPPCHLMNYKPDFMLSVAQSVPGAGAYLYLDPDIIVKCRWEEIEDWCLRGIAAIADANWLMPASSPVRSRWVQLRTVLSVSPVAGESAGALDIYCNSGFVGVTADDLGFLELWRDLMRRALDRNIYEDAALRSHLRAIGHLDQELFNLALMSFAHRCSLRGPEAMDFAPGGEVLSHAIGSPKPWQKSFIRSALIGKPPSKIDREFLRYSEGPLRTMGPWKRRRRLAAYVAARAVGAVFQRSDY